MASSTMSVGSATSRLGLRARLASRSRAARVVARPRLFPARTNNGFLRATTRNLASSLGDGVIVTPFPQRPSCPTDWWKDAVVYQIFPDRFAPDPAGHPVGALLDDWGAPPTIRSFQGGSLRGITANLDHIQSLGVNCIYMTPVFLSTANHRYHPSDFMQVDPMLGGDAAMRVGGRVPSPRHARRSRRRLQPHRTRTLGLHLPFGRPRTIPLQRLVLTKVLPRCGVRRGAIQRQLRVLVGFTGSAQTQLRQRGRATARARRRSALDQRVRRGRVAIGLSHRNPPRVLAAIPGPVPRGVSQRGDHRGNSSEFAPSLWARAGTSTRS